MEKLTRKKVIKIGRQFYRDNDIKFRFIKVWGENRSWGWAIPDESLVYVYYGIDTTPDEIASTIMHEYYHIWCYRNNKYMAYHDVFKKSLSFVNAFIRTALKAERFVDRMAKKNCKKLFPGVRYAASYRNRFDVENFEQDQLEPARRLRRKLLKKKK